MQPFSGPFDSIYVVTQSITRPDLSGPDHSLDIHFSFFSADLVDATVMRLKVSTIILH